MPQTVRQSVWPRIDAQSLTSVAKRSSGCRGARSGARHVDGTPQRSQPASADGWTYINSIIAVSPEGRVIATYDKHHLVPFGEYVPLRHWLPIDRLAPGHGSFAEGPGPKTLQIPGAPPFSPLICYEAIFPGEVVDSDLRPDWLLNLTNDAWFGTSAGPHQHLAIAKLRAIEEGMPLVRVASTAVIDPYGRISEYKSIGQQGYIDSKLPIALATKKDTMSNECYFGIMVMLVLAVSMGISRTREHLKVGYRLFFGASKCGINV